MRLHVTVCCWIERDVGNTCHANLHFVKAPVTITGQMTADYQMARFTLHALRWDISGKYKIRISHTVRSHHLQHQQQNQHLHHNPANLLFAKFCSASKNSE